MILAGTWPRQKEHQVTGIVNACARSRVMAGEPDFETFDFGVHKASWHEIFREAIITQGKRSTFHCQPLIRIFITLSIEMKVKTVSLTLWILDGFEIGRSIMEQYNSASSIYKHPKTMKY
jgi:hypothetical protein